jgi:putative acetyltransferase
LEHFLTGLGRKHVAASAKIKVLMRLSFSKVSKCAGLTGRGNFLFLGSWASAALQPRLSHCGPLALPANWWRRRKENCKNHHQVNYFASTMKITDGGLDDPRVQTLLTHHFNTARAETAPGSAHALDLSGLKSPNVRFWSAWDGDRVIAIGDLKRLSESHGEIKSMHTDLSHRRKGAGSAMLRHIISMAREMGLSRLSLETGSWPFFNPARELYRRHGFVECPPFGGYVPDPNSVFMTLELR